MKRLLTRKVVVPQVEIDAMKNEEALVRARDYVLRTAIPTLDQYVLEPFAGAVKEKVFRKAKQEHGLNQQGILNGATSETLTFGELVLDACAKPGVSTAYEKVITQAEGWLRAAARSKRERHEGVTYRSVEELKELLTDWKDDRSEAYNRKEMRVTGSPTIVLNELTVRLDKSQYARPSEKAAGEFAKARAVKGQLELYVRSFEEALAKAYRVPKKGKDFQQELEDGSAVRYLFFPKTSVEYSKVFESLVGQSTQKVSSSTGDLDVLAQCAFQPDYAYAQGKIAVSTTEENGIGIVRIARSNQNGGSTHSYRVRRKEDGLYVAVKDVQVALADVMKQKSETSMPLKVDYFPSFKE